MESICAQNEELHQAAEPASEPVPQENLCIQFAHRIEAILQHDNVAYLDIIDRLQRIMRQDVDRLEKIHADDHPANAPT